MAEKRYRLGIDVGGTNTDVVILDPDNSVVAAVKSPTTADVQGGIYSGIEKVLQDSKIDVTKISYVALGTTHATNAIIQRKELSKVSVVRICLPAGKGVPPLMDWPQDLVEAMGAEAYLVHGGYEYDGRPLAGKHLDQEECLSVLNRIKASRIESLAICSIFSPVNKDHEQEFAKLARDVLGPEVAITLSSEIGSLGFIERENSTVLNAAVVNVAKKAANGLREALNQFGIKTDVFFAQNDGTLMSLDYAIRYPILTIGSGPTNSLRGAAYLTNEKDCIVVDIGGTSTDVGIMVKGFPRQSSIAVEVGGVLTNFRMPDLISIGVGGGSIVREENGEIKVGPDSVGYEITKKALCFGGDVITATDVALASGIAHIDDPRCDLSRLASLDTTFVKRAMNKIIELVSDACDRIKTSSKSLPVVLVGGGSILIPDRVPGMGKIIRPENFGCANAIGAATAEASGEVDTLWSLDNVSREEAINQARKQAIDRAVQMGAEPDKTQVVDMEMVPLTYLPGNVVRIKSKAAGPLTITNT
ncbi:N-methylhydantoinase A/oxoprolinase/acetone carboxylase beta subunit [Caldalkalibacillus uzonensis]|uniref:N-methylhydantoinase A/oxoprolinase/acetone carboxylase beta subunit n=1 Tax=Caldalkalibacillus uzonensis TaxID=353224 RepID=A0ABU0CYE0_9BACI|nr:hydantoinase/oxoprolinase family protein [Caldalkalibacillus uzonensis]MDQ0341168.1 N-methylhydantoinase A/oxoprolinase/acetone carboxylase beta subunit [Caldalkalibacillus uzonensis]